MIITRALVREYESKILDKSPFRGGWEPRVMNGKGRDDGVGNWVEQVCSILSTSTKKE